MKKWIIFSLIVLFTQTGATLASKHKITICHVPPGNPTNTQTIKVARQAWEAGHTPHNKHSLDYVGSCTNPNTPVPATHTPNNEPTATIILPSNTPIPTLEPRPTKTNPPPPTTTSTPIPPTNTAIPAKTMAPTNEPCPTTTIQTNKSKPQLGILIPTTLKTSPELLWHYAASYLAGLSTGLIMLIIALMTNKSRRPK